MRNSTTPTRRRLAELAGRQHGVVSSRAAARPGVRSTGAIARRIESGRLHRLYRGVYAVGHTIVNRRGRYLAAVLACGDGAVLSHRSAAALWGIRPSASARIDVTVPRTSGVRSTCGDRRPSAAAHGAGVVRDGIPVTTAGRTLADLATALPRRPLEKACEAAEALRLDIDVDPAHPGREAARRDRARPRARRPAARSRTSSSRCATASTSRGRWSTAVVEGYLVDFCWPEQRLIVETDGGRHLTRAAFERDRARDALLTATGWRVMRFTGRQVRRAAGRGRGARAQRA